MKLRTCDDLKKYADLQVSRSTGTDEHLNISLIEKYLPKNKDAYILDVGCRSGKTIKHLIEIGYDNAYGMDLGDSTWIDYAPNIKQHFIKQDIHDGIFLNGKLDLILCSHAFEHMRDPNKIIEIFKSNLNENGIIYISVPLDYSSIEMRHTPHYTFFESKDDLKNYLESKNLDVVDIYVNNSGPGGFPEVLSFSKKIN